MKLLLCDRCGDIFALRIDVERACECGRVTGGHLGGRDAVTNGKGVVLEIDNGSLRSAVSHVTIGSRTGIYPVHCWVRGNSGPSNPYTSVVEGNDDAPENT